jgi:Fe-S cluster assembly ATPase SufC
LLKLAASNRKCEACHGPEGRGKCTLAKIIGAPRVGFSKSLSINYLGDDELISVIRD